MKKNQLSIDIDFLIENNNLLIFVAKAFYNN